MISLEENLKLILKGMKNAPSHGLNKKIKTIFLEDVETPEPTDVLPSKYIRPPQFNSSLANYAMLATVEDAKAGNTQWIKPEYNIVIDCFTNKKYVNPNIIVKAKFEPASQTEWWNSQKNLESQGKNNLITACSYYIKILELQNKLGLKENESVDTKVQECITLEYMAYSSKPKGCTTEFQIFSIDGTKKIETRRKSWWSIEYSDGYLEDKNYTPVAPYTYLGPEYSYYAEIDGEESSVFDVETLSTDLKTEKKDDETISVSVVSSGSKYDSKPNLPLTKSELDRYNTNPFNSDNTFKQGGYYVCIDYSKTSHVNMRTTPEVNEDQGLLDPTDNYINWTANEVIGKFVTKKDSSQFYCKKTEGQPLEFHEKWAKVRGVLNKNQLKNLNDAAPKKCNQCSIACYVDTTKLSDDVIKIAKKNGAITTWYQVELDNEVDSKNNEGTYKKVWVSSNYTKFCDTKSKESTINYDTEELKRVPVLPSLFVTGQKTMEMDLQKDLEGKVKNIKGWKKK